VAPPVRTDAAGLANRDLPAAAFAASPTRLRQPDTRVPKASPSGFREGEPVAVPSAAAGEDRTLASASACSSPARLPRGSRLDPEVPIESVRLGKFIKVAGERYDYFCLVTDVQLDATNADVLRDPPGRATHADALLREVLSGTATYGTIKLRPELMLGHPAL